MRTEAGPTHWLFSETQIARVPQTSQDLIFHFRTSVRDSSLSNHHSRFRDPVSGRAILGRELVHSKTQGWGRKEVGNKSELHRT